MVPFLLIISFLLHIITLFAIFQLAKQQQTNQKDSSSQDVMEVFEVYLEEIREENNRLEKLLEKQNSPSTNTKAFTNEGTELKKEMDPVPDDENEEFDILLKHSPQDEVNASLESRVLQLHTQGKGIEEIAKTLNCGKTEAELIIKLYRKK